MRPERGKGQVNQKLSIPSEGFGLHPEEGKGSLQVSGGKGGPEPSCPAYRVHVNLFPCRSSTSQPLTAVVPSRYPSWWSGHMKIAGLGLGGHSFGMECLYSCNFPFCSKTTPPPSKDTHTTKRSHSAWKRTRLSGQPLAERRRGQETREDKPGGHASPHSPSDSPWSVACSSRPWPRPRSHAAAPRLTLPGQLPASSAGRGLTLTTSPGPPLPQFSPPC